MKTMMSATPVLVLNATYEAINITSARHALTLIVKGSAIVEESREIRVHRDYMLPSVVRLRNYRRIPSRVQVVSRKNLYARDNYTCQYCGEEFAAKDLTLDHVMPKSRGGMSRWENLVTCCKPCNHRKGDRTPEEAGMVLLRIPRQLTIHTSRGMLRMAGHTEQAWRKYLYFN
jgi:5-methylcytosine-specific restriction endonuclease McrA